ncbi:PIN domain-containing protein [Thiofilum flexile]|uniref:PIN domain-containing protein n=1 Tax=Thiofilum flexile TaxID=125627 RepID=UPI000374F526|nr:PIN domain-containing protein [Thiofilum flexile]
MSANFTVIYDACVLYPAPLRDLLMQLALTNTFRARWSAQIQDEWIRNLIKNRPDLNQELLEKTASMMNRAVMDALVTGYESLIDGLTLPDADDRHVVAAAIKGQAEVIVTFNLKDFPQDYLSEFDLWAQHPDEFIRDLIDLTPETVLLAAHRCRARLKNPPKLVDDYLDTLLAQQLPLTVNFLRKNKELL